MFQTYIQRHNLSVPGSHMHTHDMCIPALRPHKKITWGPVRAPCRVTEGWNLESEE